MRYYAGLDVSMKETFICIVNEKGKTFCQGQVPSDPEAIALYLKGAEVPIEKAAIESGSISHWLVTELQKMDIPVICVDARHMSSMLAMTVNKTDSNDAYGIANALRGGFVREVSLKPPLLVEINTILQSRSILVQERTKLKNAVRGLLKSFGIRISTTGQKSFIKEVRTLIQDKPSSVKLAIDALLNTFEVIMEQIQVLETRIYEIAREDKNVQLLMTIPGVGVLTALSFIVALGNYERFEDSRNVAAYLGLTPRQYSSGEVQRMGRISKCGSRDARSLLVEAATVMLTRTRSWCKPKAWAMKLQRKKGFKKASVALARKLAVIMHRMLVNQEPFYFGEAPEELKEKIA